MELNREVKSMAAVMALVAAMAFGFNYLVVPNTDSSFIAWSLGLLAVAVLLWAWMRHDALAKKREQTMKAAEEAASQAEELAQRVQGQAEAELESGADDARDDLE